jgi:hypothetical protein
MLPLKLAPLNETTTLNFQKRFLGRSVREGVWRRHQCKENAALSGWSSDEDQRRRLIHYRDQYSAQDNHFVLDQTYLFFNVRNKKESIRKYNTQLYKALQDGQWVEVDHGRFQLEGMHCTVEICEHTGYDIEQGLVSPDYQNLSLSLFSVPPDAETIERPWKILSLGIRDALPKGNPKYGDIDDIAKHLPAHVELGCGPSIEAGVLPLNYLHSIYSISHPDKSFVFEAEHDRVFEFLSDTKSKYQETSRIHQTCLTAPVGQFYYDLRSLIDLGQILEPVITNNFDGIPLSVGIKDFYLRDYDRTGIYPNIPIHPEAKSLIVIGSHADRRGAQQCARKAGLQIIFIDTEGYQTENGFVAYPLEAPQDEDIVIKASAEEAIRRLHESSLHRVS